MKKRLRPGATNSPRSIQIRRKAFADEEAIETQICIGYLVCALLSRKAFADEEAIETLLRLFVPQLQGTAGRRSLMKKRLRQIDRQHVHQVVCCRKAFADEEAIETLERAR